jgi:hypothetical protein
VLPVMDIQDVITRELVYLLTFDDREGSGNVY